jgi:hypothetical protein
MWFLVFVDTGRVFINKPIIKITQNAKGVVIHTSAGDRYEVKKAKNKPFKNSAHRRLTIAGRDK